MPSCILPEGKSATASHELQNADIQNNEKGATASHLFVIPGRKLISILSYSHIREILTLDDPFARYFYEQECMKCTWSVCELRRQISTNLYVRAGISANPEKMLSLPSVQGHDSAELQIRQPFTFEFLGLKAKEVVDEHDLGKEDGGVCPCWHGQPTVRLHLYAAVTRQEDSRGFLEKAVGGVNC